VRKGWGTHGRWEGLLNGTLAQMTDDGTLLSFTVLQDGARKTVTMPKTDARVIITESVIIITEVPNA
jgi:hypothetical protein